jgi:hypothetical protein
MREFHGKTGRIIGQEGKQYRVRLDTPVEIPGVGEVEDDLWDGNLLMSLDARYSARDADPNENEEFKREQYDDPSEGGDEDYPHTAANPELARYLTDEMGWDDKDDIEAACAYASKMKDMSCDDPADLPHGGEPRPGGSKTPFRPGNSREELKSRPGMDSRNAAMDAVRRIQVDTISVPVQHSSAPPPPQSKKAKLKLAADASSRAMAEFAQRWPEVARIKQA